MRNLFVFSYIFPERGREREEDRENLYLYFCLIMHARGVFFFFFERVTSSRKEGNKIVEPVKLVLALEPSGS